LVKIGFFNAKIGWAYDKIALKPSKNAKIVLQIEET
jgi:hypothetical protein